MFGKMQVRKRAGRKDKWERTEEKRIGKLVTEQERMKRRGKGDVKEMVNVGNRKFMKEGRNGGSERRKGGGEVRWVNGEGL